MTNTTTTKLTVPADPNSIFVVHAIKMSAGHSPNGNPQRVYLIFQGDTPIEYIDEGYLGDQAVYEKYAFAFIYDHGITIIKSCYDKLVKLGKLSK
jgi:hypothetical protein